MQIGSLVWRHQDLQRKGWHCWWRREPGWWPTKIKTMRVEVLKGMTGEVGVRQGNEGSPHIMAKQCKQKDAKLDQERDGSQVIHH